jgi:hypothetical protein
VIATWSLCRWSLCGYSVSTTYTIAVRSLCGYCGHFSHCMVTMRSLCGPCGHCIVTMRSLCDRYMVTVRSPWAVAQA